MADYQNLMTSWIWPGNSGPDDGQPMIYYFRKDLDLPEQPTTATIRVSADSRYRLYVNGVSVAFGPCKGDGEIWYYDEVDIAPHLQTGINCLAAVVLRFSPLGRGNVSVWRTNYPGFYLKGKLAFTGREQTLASDGSWRSAKAEHIRFLPESPYMSYLNIVENASGNSAFFDWQTAGYNDSGWSPVIPYHYFSMPASVSPANLNARPIPPMFEKQQRLTGVVCQRQSSLAAAVWQELLQGQALSIAPHQTEIIELDAGELTTGFLQLSTAGGQGAVIEILTSECYAYPPEKTDRMPAPVKKDRIDWRGGQLYGLQDQYAVSGFGTADQPEKYEPFWFRTFRFIRLKITTGDLPLQLLEFSYRETGYPLEPVTGVIASDPDFAGIWDISLRSLRRCMHETYEDCPFYEQLQYAMDTRAQILFTYSVAADDRMARRAIDDFNRSLRGDGLTGACYPTTSPNIIPGFALYYVMMIHDHMMYFGDPQLVERYSATIEAILGFFHRNLDSRGLVGQVGHVIGSKFWSFIDWTKQWDRTAGVPSAIWRGPITMESLLYASTLQMAAELADYIKRPDQAALFRSRYSELKTAINQHCVGPDGYYQDGPGVEEYSHHAQVWAVLADVAPARAWPRLLRLTLDRGDLARCSVAMSYYWFRALEKAGMYDETEQLWDVWRQMLRDNLTTCVEDPVTQRSDCHAWGALALYEFPAAILGVRPLKPGFAAAEIKPRALYLDWARGVAATPKGPVEVAWEKVNGEIKVTYKAPDGVEIIN